MLPLEQWRRVVHLHRDDLAGLAALDDPDAGGVVLFGAAGVGMTRLARCAVDMAEDRGLVTASVRANRSASLIPFGALAPLFAELELPVEVNAGLLGAAADAVRRRRGNGRMLLAVDDAQELDDASGALLDHLLATGDVQVVLTARLGDQQAAAIHEMFVNTLGTSAGSYAATEVCNAAAAG